LASGLSIKRSIFLIPEWFAGQDKLECLSLANFLKVSKLFVSKGAFTLANFARDFALSLHVLLNENYLFSLLNVQASVKSCTKSRQCKRTLRLESIRVENLMEHHHIRRLIHSPTIIKLARKKLARTNTLAYFSPRRVIRTRE
jgi:hypothetical protein